MRAGPKTLMLNISMKRIRGFTVVELVVVMTIMAILLTLGFVSLNASQVNARNMERGTDIEAIAKGLEARYVRSNISANASYINKGSYPSVYELQHMEGLTVATITPTQTTQYLEQALPGTRMVNFAPPNITSAVTTTFIPMCSAPGVGACAANNNAEDATKISTVVANSSVYVYEPIDANNQICFNTECVRYNLYYLPEGGTVQQKVGKKQ